MALASSGPEVTISRQTGVWQVQVVKKASLPRPVSPKLIPCAHGDLAVPQRKTPREIQGGITSSLPSFSSSSSLFRISPLSFWGTAVAQWLMCCATNRKVAGSIPDGVSGNFIDMKSFRSHYGPGVDSASKGNEERRPVRKADNLTTILCRCHEIWVPGAIPGGKGGRCVRLTTLPPSCAVVMKSGYQELFLGVKAAGA